MWLFYRTVSADATTSRIVSIASPFIECALVGQTRGKIEKKNYISLRFSSRKVSRTRRVPETTRAVRFPFGSGLTVDRVVVVPANFPAACALSPPQTLAPPKNNARRRIALLGGQPNPGGERLRCVPFRVDRQRVPGVVSFCL